MNANSIGDTVAGARLFFALYHYAQLKQLRKIAILHIANQIELKLTCEGQIDSTWAIYTELLTLYKKANILDDFTYICGISDEIKDNPSSRQKIEDTIKHYFSKRNASIECMLDNKLELWNHFHSIISSDAIIKFYQERFAFLKEDITENYNIVQYCSHHYSPHHVDKFAKCHKRISFSNLTNWIESNNIIVNKFVGSTIDYDLTQRCIEKLQPLYPNKIFINMCGDLYLEDTFKQIYNASNVLSTESFAGLLGGVFNKPSIIYFRHELVQTLLNFKSGLDLFPNLTMKLDNVLTEND
jgi:hypothetical protein